MRAAPDEELGDAFELEKDQLTERKSLEASIFITGVQGILHRRSVKTKGRNEAR